VLQKGDIKMIKKFLEQGLSKSEIARRLGIARNTVTRYAHKPDGYVPVIQRNPIDVKFHHVVPFHSKQ